MDIKLLILLVAAATLCAAAKFKECKGTAITTRQWDCCKQGCSWATPDRAKTCTSPVKSCLKDGITPAPPNEKAGCSGGKAYVCNDMQPFEEDGKAYAYAAAATIEGVSDLCCACFELTFIQGKIKGKKLTIQITNGSAGDLGLDGKNQFDIQMPMSGRGLFPKGCINQWGLPDEVWGIPYGGITKEEQCHKGPKELLKGCLWRFGPFLQDGLDKVSFKRVSCPKCLTDISGCKRLDD